LPTPGVPVTKMLGSFRAYSINLIINMRPFLLAALAGLAAARLLELDQMYADTDSQLFNEVYNETMEWGK
jgi:hypothetical protein